MSRARANIKKAAAGIQALVEPISLPDLPLQEEDKRELQSCLQQFNYLLGRTLENIRQKGELLLRMRRLLERNGLEGRWYWFVENVLHISGDTAANWIYLHEFAMQQEDVFQKLVTCPTQVGAVYSLRKLFSDPELRDDVRAFVERLSPEELAQLTPEKVRRAAVVLEAERSNLAPQVKEAIKQLPVERRDIRVLEKLPASGQERAVALALQSGDKRLRQIVKRVKEWLEYERIVEEQQELPERAGVDMVYYHGDWREVLPSLPVEAYGVVLCELPFQHEWVTAQGRSFFRRLGELVMPGGVALVAVGKKSLPYVGALAEGSQLEAGWVFGLRRASGHHPRVMGLNIMSAYVPLVFFYRQPLRKHGMVADMLSYDELPSEPDVPLEGHYSYLEPSEQERELNTLERALRYYMEAFMQPEDEVLHLIIDPVQNFGPVARLSVLTACRYRRAKRLTTLAGLPVAGD